MSSLWTPGGEHEVPKDRPAPTPQADAPQAGGDDPTAMPGGMGIPEAAMAEMVPGYEELTDEEKLQAQAMVAEMAQARQRIAETPAVEVVANHVMGLYELGAIHLSLQPPNMAEAAVAIDAMAGVMDKMEGRLGENEPSLVQARSQLQMAFVELTKMMEAEGGAQA